MKTEIKEGFCPIIETPFIGIVKGTIYLFYKYDKDKSCYDGIVLSNGSMNGQVAISRDNSDNLYKVGYNVSIHSGLVELYSRKVELSGKDVRIIKHSYDDGSDPIDEYYNSYYELFSGHSVYHVVHTTDSRVKIGEQTHGEPFTNPFKNESIEVFFGTLTFEND